MGLQDPICLHRKLWTGIYGYGAYHGDPTASPQLSSGILTKEIQDLFRDHVGFRGRKLAASYSLVTGKFMPIYLWLDIMTLIHLCIYLDHMNELVILLVLVANQNLELQHLGMSERNG